MYVDFNPKTKKALKEAVKNGERMTIFQLGPFDNSATRNGRGYVEGPHYPQPHRWYATATLENGLVIKVK